MQKLDFRLVQKTGPFKFLGTRITIGPKSGARQDISPYLLHCAKGNHTAFIQASKIFGKGVDPVAVGTVVTRRPPHSAVRAELPHTALA